MEPKREHDILNKIFEHRKDIRKKLRISKQNIDFNNVSIMVN